MISYRALAATDAPRAATVIRDCFSDQGLATSPPSSALKESDEAVAHKLSVGGGFGAFDGATLVGAVLWSQDGDALYLGRLAVVPARRGAGIAGKLVALVEAEALRRGFTKVRLRARLQLAKNVRFFERLGYRAVAEGAHVGFDQPTYAIFEKPLGGGDQHGNCE